MLGCGFVVSGFWVLVRYWVIVGLGLQLDGFWGWLMGRFWDFRGFVVFFQVFVYLVIFLRSNKNN